ncbi:MAG: M48 family metallopeptidase [Cyanobacteria bacterium HKST-UBA02]|nr:M48 family metallopeptidase [Cyanobacteria bacterium HKST-UBA02]
MEFKARCYTKDSSDPVACDLRVLPGELEVSGSDLSLKFPVDELDLEVGGQMSDRIKLSHAATGAVVLVDGPNFLDCLRKTSPSSRLALTASKVEHEVKHAPLLRGGNIVGFFGCIALILGIGYLTLDFWVDLAARYVPPSAESKLGEMLLPEDLKKPTESKEANRVEKIGQKLILNMKASDYKFEFFVSPEDELNAYALPGGKIVVLSGLLREAKSDDEIAGVIGHEIGHVVHRDTLRRLLHTSGLGVSLAIISGGFISNEQIKGILPAVQNIEGLSYSRGQEAAADKIGVRLTMEAGYDPEGIIHLFERMEKDNPHLPKAAMMLISDHPLTADRIKAMHDEIAQLRKKGDKN